MKLTQLDRRYYVTVGVLTYATLAVIGLLLVLRGYNAWAVSVVLLAVLWPFGIIGRALKRTPRKPPPESN